MKALVEYRADQSAWLAAVNEMGKLASALPDGAQRLTAFNREMRFCDRWEDYLTQTDRVVDGIIVVVSAPGPKTAAFLDQLRDCARAGRA